MEQAAPAACEASPAASAAPAPACVIASGDAVVLPSHCTVKDAAALKESLVAQLDAAAVRLDASNVERIDTSSMQVLCAFVRDRRAQGRDVEWIKAPGALHAAARLLGVTALLNLPAGASA